MTNLIAKAAFVALALTPFTAAPAAGPTVTIDSGRLEGSEANGVESFKGIPFAAPPVGKLRWRAPQPVVAWHGTLQANRYGDDCAQTPFPSDAAPLAAPLSEDCLNLNVWRPDVAKGSPGLPVLVWIHGGGFVNGGTSPAIFDGSSFARDGVILVSINYRLGRFGFFDHPALENENADNGRHGNFGLMDQIAALKWIQRNIAAFGGDPHNVTVMGESAGGSSVHMLMTSPEAKGLFERAIIQSGGGRSTGSANRMLRQDKPGVPSLETVGKAFAERNGIVGDGPEALEKLRAWPADKIAAGLHMGTTAQQADIFGGPSIDGRFAVAPLETLYDAGRVARIPLIVGATNADLGPIQAKDKAAAFALFGDNADKARQAYDPDGTRDDRGVISAIGADRTMVEPARFAADRLRAAGGTAYVYRFSYVAQSMRDTWHGAPHASEVPYVMGTVSAKYGDRTSKQDLAASELMHRYWVNFAKTGDPNGPGLPRWPAYSPASDEIMDFSAKGVAQPGRDPWEKRLDLVCSSFSSSPCASRTVGDKR